jgi:hypothetical protein
MTGMICESCKFDVKSTSEGLCETCIKVIRCTMYIRRNSLCGCGHALCVHNDKKRRERAAKLERALALRD